MLRVGLTGGIATGKSHVLRRVAALGLPVLDLDAVAHEVIAPGGRAYADVVGAFGPAALGEDGTVDRKRLGRIVFADRVQRERLNAIVHPRIREVEAEWAAARAPGDAVLVTDAALLVETGMHLRYDRLVVVWCPAPVQLARLQARDVVAEADARARVAAQMPVDEKRRFGHFVVDTSGQHTDTDVQVDAVVAQLRAAVARRPSPAAPPPDVVREDLWTDGARALLAAARAQGLVDIGALARAAGCPGPWWECGHGEGPVAMAWVPALVRFALESRGFDPEWLASAAASLARLYVAPGPGRVMACRKALALGERWAGGAAAADWTPLAERWGGSGS